MNRNKTILIFILPFLLSIQSVAQVLFTARDEASEFERGMELFNKEKYPAAIRLFDSFIEKGEKSNLITIADAEYFRSLAALNLFNPDAEFRIVSFIRTHPESPRLNDARLALGNYFYQNKNYRKAATYFEEVNRQELSSDKLPEYFFRLGYSLYVRGEKPRALLMFSEIKDIDTEYTPPATYYFSQIAYEQKMYQTAMEGFNKLKNDETFGSVVPFYIIQILYLQKDYDQILALGPEILNSAPRERAIELYRFIGDAYYNKGSFKEALPYFEKFASGTKISDREDKYQLGYCYYKTGDLDKAIKLFREIGVRSDILTQNIWFLLGDSYLQKGDKKHAQFGFAESAKMNFDKKIQEDALFNYAKLTYETSYSPFGETIAAFQAYIDRYPGSDRIEEAYNYLVSTFLQDKNYKAALSSLDKIRNKDIRLEEAYQRVAYYRGLELFRNMELEAAIDMLDKSLKYGKYNRQLRAGATYWRGEAYYRLGRYENARNDYTEFIGTPSSMSLIESKLVRYNLGYALFNLKDYSNAKTHLLSFESGASNVKSEVLYDARNRIADCYYITTDYPGAIAFYDKVIDYGKLNADYAMFQKGFTLGLINDERGKTDILSSLINKYPSSSYVPNALFERGRAFMTLEDFKKSESDFNSVITTYPASAFVPRSMVQLGLLYNNMGENDKAIVQYRKVIESYKSTPEARNAMTGLKNTYIEINDVESYFAYVRTVQGGTDINLSEKDSLLYSSGENLYITGKYDRAAEVFKNYLTGFPSGGFRQNAQFYLAECYRSSGKTDDALKLYAEVANAPGNQFTEQSLIAAATICYRNEDFEVAYNYYSKLESAAGNSENRIIALRGLLRSAYQMGDAPKTIAATDKINNSINIPEELLRESVFMGAKANYSLNNFDEALADFRKTATEVVSAEGAESKYRVAELLYKKDQIAESERIITEFIDQNSPHQYWMARMFLLLSDISVKKGDILQARATLQSLKDYYTIDNDGILDEVKAKLEALSQNG
jgi:TolA-binding protein